MVFPTLETEFPNFPIVIHGEFLFPFQTNLSHLPRRGVYLDYIIHEPGILQPPYGSSEKARPIPPDRREKDRTLSVYNDPNVGIRSSRFGLSSVEVLKMKPAMVDRVKV
jgi:hypothetical protein